MELIVKVNSFLNGIVMGWPGMILLVGTGVYYTIRCGGVQFKWFGYIMKTTIGKIFDKKEAGRVYRPCGDGRHRKYRRRYRRYRPRRPRRGILDVGIRPVRNVHQVR